MGYLEDIERTRFLGEEFLTWLWFRSETEPELDLGERGKVRLDIGDPMVLRGQDDHDATLVTIKGERASISAEALESLRAGKKLAKCKLLVQQEDQVWACTVNADSLAFGSLTLPVPKGLPMPDSLILRGERLEEFAQMYFAIFEIFLGLRLREKEWKKVAVAIHHWGAA